MTTSVLDESSGSTAELFFDPVCPWAWMTSRWLIEAAAVRDLNLKYSLMSLSVLNHGRDIPEEYQELMERAWGPVRVITAAALADPDRAGQTVPALYTAIGTRIHPGRQGSDAASLRAVLVEALSECALPPELIEAAENVPGDPIDQALRASHQRAMDLVGDDVGTPVIAVDGTAFFGPVITPAPKGEQAGKLWDGCVLVAGTPGFYELKRSRTAEPDFS